ncbi:MAG: hypothetical protein BWY63_02351 [Chloroflexi bacterium ADurb.Bin360]|nr:MAG: hypothetical protein BWY63_02351 [Chloroflexi bacterium ADurb.Bin360]
MTLFDPLDQRNSIFLRKTLNEIYDEIVQVYLSNEFPWVIGFSGGKDSTATLQLVWNALKTLPREKLNKHVHVVASDTMVEAPAIAARIDISLEQMNQAAGEDGLPFTAHKVVPSTDDSFWVNLIGRGYPAPYARFRWCTERLKIKPINQFIMNRVTEYGEVVVVLGVRKQESFTREQVINLHKITGNRLSRHAMLPGAYVYTPIEDFTAKDVWDYLELFPSPWGVDNSSLRELYESAQGECPAMVIDTLTPSCGNTRFGCWVCTVVEQDRSMQAMTEKGGAWMRPLLDYRDFLASTQDPANKPDQRNMVRRNGQVWVKDGKLIFGPYSFEFRQELLRRLLRSEALVRALGPDPGIVLIQPEELHAIRRIWRSEESDWTDTLPQIFEEETGEKLDWVQDDSVMFGVLEEHMLSQICEVRDVPLKLVQQLLGIEQAFDGARRRYNIYKKIEAALSRDWRSNEEIWAAISDSATSTQEDEDLCSSTD